VADYRARVTGLVGMVGAVTTIVFGALHPKGSSEVGTVHEWMTRVGASDIWILDHLMLLFASVLLLIASVGIARAYPEPRAQVWAELAFVANIIATAIAVVTFLFDGAVVKNVADALQATPNDAASRGAARLATETGFILVSGLQISTGTVALLFGLAGVTSRAHPRWLGWLSVTAAMAALVPGATHYIAGSSTWSLSLVYVSSALLAVWFFVMSARIWRAAATTSA
jgi:hypothetical protein